MKLIITVIINFVTGIMGFIFTPIDTLISSNMPNLAYALSQVANFFLWLVQFVNWALSWLPLSANTWSFIIATLIFRFTIPIVVDSVKLIVKWWHALVP